MSSLRQRYRVSWDDGPVLTVTTNARDVAAVAPFLPKIMGDDGNLVVDQAKAMTDPNSMFRLVHAALVRTDTAGDVPTAYDDWLDVVDECAPLDLAPAAPPDPTSPAISASRP